MQAVLGSQGIVKGLMGGSGLTPQGSLVGKGAWKALRALLYPSGGGLGVSPSARGWMHKEME
jgi:hypothetical protein